MKNGSTMIEVLVAVGISVVGLLALIQISTKSVNNSGYSTRQSQANAYASAEIENIRSSKERLGWSIFKQNNGGGTSCSNVGQFLEFSSCVTISYRNDASTNNIEQMIVNVEVSWVEAGRDTAGTRPAAKQQTVFTRF